MRFYYLCLAAALLAAAPGWTQETARGFVYHDANENLQRDAGESGIAEVAVSNGREVVLTGADGGYALPVDDDTGLFVVKPPQWRTAFNDLRLPKFYYLHKPEGSPKLRYKGVPPTGPLPESVDFPLYPEEESETFDVLLFGDTQPYSLREIHYMAQDVVPELVGTDASLAISLGDLVGDRLTLFEPLNQLQSTIGIPFYNVLGNHDMDFESPNDIHSDEAYEATYGPPYYAFCRGKAVFLVLDDVIWLGREEGYKGGLGDVQLTFIENYLATLPKDRIIVLTMHIPMTEIEDRARLFEALAPFPHTVSFSAHFHRQMHLFFGEDDGWRGETPHHHLIHGTVCGSWWRGPRDDEDLPLATMSDGTPNGYSIVRFDGTDYAIRYKVARRPADYQMRIDAPRMVQAGESGDHEVAVNVFSGSEKNTVEMRVGDSETWIPLKRTVKPDPFYSVFKQREAWLTDTLRPMMPESKQADFELDQFPGIRENYGRSLPGIHDNPHLWVARLPGNLPPGMHVVEVRTTDMFGQVFHGRRIVHVQS